MATIYQTGSQINLPPLSQSVTQIPRGPINIQGSTYVPVETQTYVPMEIQTQVPIDTIETENRNVVTTPATTTKTLVPMRVSRLVPEETEVLVPVKVKKLVKKTNDILVPVFEKTQKFMHLPGNTQIEELPNLTYQTKTAPIIQNTTFTPALPQATISQLTSPIQTTPITPVTTTMTTTTQVQNPDVSSYTIASNPAPISGIQNLRTEVPPLSEEEINQILNQANLQSPPTTVQTEIQNYDIPSYQTEIYPQMDTVSVPQTTQITSVPQPQYQTISSPVQYDVQNYQIDTNPVTTITQEMPQPISVPTPIPSPIPAPVSTTITTTMTKPIPAPVPTTIPVPAPSPIIRTSVAQPLPVRTYSVSSIRPVTVTRVQAVPQPASSLLVTNVSRPLPVPVARPLPITNYSVASVRPVAVPQRVGTYSVASVRPVAVPQPTYSVTSVRPVAVPQPLAVPRPLPASTYSVASVRPALVAQPVTRYSITSVRPVAVPQPLPVATVTPLVPTAQPIVSAYPVQGARPVYSTVSIPVIR